MSPYEQRLLVRIDLLIGERNAANQRAGEYLKEVSKARRELKRRRRPAPQFFCHYCGRRVLDGRITCAPHSDLPALDPFYAEPETVAA